MKEKELINIMYKYFKKNNFKTKEINNISLWKKWLKININNNYTISSKYKWRISPKYQLYLKVCILCRAFLIIYLYLSWMTWVIDMGLLNNEFGLLSVLFNTLIIFLPIFVIELLIVLSLPLEIIEEKTSKLVPSLSF